MKKRLPHQRTSAPGISAYLHRRGIEPLAVRSDVQAGRWVIQVNCSSMPQAETVWSALKNGGYNLLEMFGTWVIIAEKQTAEAGVL